MAISPLVVPVRTMRSRSKTMRIEVSAPLDRGVIAPATEADSSVPPDAEARCSLVLAPYQGGISARGRVAVQWQGMCRRCTKAVSGVLDIAIDERFCDPAGLGDQADGEAYPIVDGRCDLGPMVHEAILAELPLAPLCKPDCQGLCPQCGTDRNEVTCACVAPVDPRWASLDVLKSRP
ncbi:MAG: YceD family protein [Acidimicrobiales bacterium]